MTGFLLPLLLVHKPFLSLSKFYLADEFTFATIQGQTATRDDVEAYVKADLNIGQEGFPNNILAGDEQTYSILMNLKQNNGQTFDWLYPVPRDWHYYVKINC